MSSVRVRDVRLGGFVRETRGTMGRVGLAHTYVSNFCEDVKMCGRRKSRRDVPWPRTAAKPCSSLHMGRIPVKTTMLPA